MGDVTSIILTTCALISFSVGAATGLKRDIPMTIVFTNGGTLLMLLDISLKLA